MASRYRHRSHGNKAFLRFSPKGEEDVETSKTVTEVLDLSKVFNAFKQIVAEKGIDLCGFRLSDGDLEQELTFAGAGSGDVYDVTIQLRLSTGIRFENEGNSPPPVLEGVISKSEIMREVSRLVLKVAAEPDSTIISGESGTGKELIAKAIHHHSSRAKEPFIAINCALIPATLIESELFGHQKGAFTGAITQHKGLFEQAGAGTLFLDEIGELELSLQSKLLRVLQERTFRRLGGDRDLQFNARVIAASNRNLYLESNAGRFRSDLYHRLRTFEISLPPLRERGDDIFLITNHQIKKLNRERGKNIVGLAPEAADLFRRYSWPGNVRELINTITRAVVLEDGDLITATYLPPEMKVKEGHEERQTARSNQVEEPQSVGHDVEFLLVLEDGESVVSGLSRTLLAIYRQVRERCGSHSAAARRLGVHRVTLGDWLENAERGWLVINAKQ